MCCIDRLNPQSEADIATERDVRFAPAVPSFRLAKNQEQALNLLIVILSEPAMLHPDHLKTIFLGEALKV